MCAVTNTRFLSICQITNRGTKNPDTVSHFTRKNSPYNKYVSYFLFYFLQKRYTFWLIYIALLTDYHKRSCENVPRFLTLSAGFYEPHLQYLRCDFVIKRVGIVDKIRDE